MLLWKKQNMHVLLSMWCLCKALACSTISIRKNKAKNLRRKTRRWILKWLWARSNMTAGLTVRSEEKQEKEKRKKKKTKRHDLD